MARVIHRLPALQAVFDLAQSTIYLHVSQGLLPKPVSLGPRAVGWPADEIDKIINARIAGKDEADIKSLVSSLMAARQLAA
ncbi:AlpA family transcriptional regulator [Massilia sp. CCM 8734]|uniref:helix-turn-helix transcriptional regulator n=1 Tax=Massilia sp. CCM 8734 TaxID=2609283 RepID=UPI00142283DC|nr:AlpA family phage regulatory protein [Massilia sp. CCM 8734]NIA00088.1 AlpA family phage regulatory protein [Massilia sp. CCM 8734]